MNEVVYMSFLDELEKIATGNSVTVSSTTMQAPSAPNPVSSTISSGSKPPTKPTNYTVVHNQKPTTAIGTADPAKALPPPPVRA